MEKNHGEGGEIIDLAKKRDERERSKRGAEAKESEISTEDAQEEMILNFDEHQDPANFMYEVDWDLIGQGWKALGSVEINEDTLKNKKKFLELIGWKNVTIKKSKTKPEFGDKPALVFYGKN